MRNKTVRACIFAVLAVFLLALAGTALTLQRDGGESIEIVSDGTVVYSGPAKAEGEPVYVPVQTERGMNLVRIDAEGVCVESADCPGQECVSTGYLKSAYLPVVCLPHRLVIRFAKTPGEGAPDAVSE